MCIVREKRDLVFCIETLPSFVKDRTLSKFFAKNEEDCEKTPYYGTMPLVLSHISALEYWLSVRRGPRSFVRVSRARSLLSSVPSLSSEKVLGPWWLARPLHAIVAGQELRRPSSEFVCHVWSGLLPKGSVLDAQNGFCVCSPELCFLQMANSLSMIELIMLGFELCGTYDVSDGDVRECQPLTSVAKLSAFAEKMHGVNGRKNALAALKQVVGGSASPRETALCMCLCLPYRLGGYGFEKPELNHRIDIPSTLKSHVRQSYFVGDLCWPERRLDVEYDGSLHLDADRRASDEARRTVLETMGFTVVAVTRKQFNSVAATHAVAETLALHLGRRLRFRDPSFSQVRLRLRTKLFEGSRYGLPPMGNPLK